MGRPSKPWFRETKKCWYATIDGRKVNLGRDKEQAFRTFHRLKADEGIRPAVDVQTLRIEEIIDDYLLELKQRVGGRTYRVADGFLKRFRCAFGRMTVTTLTRRQVGRWLGEQSGWSPTTANHVASRILAIFNWGVREGVLVANPLKGLSKPRARSRGVEALIPTDSFHKLLDPSPDYLRTILTVLHETGARPGEVLSVTAIQFHPEQQVWLLTNHKTVEATGRPRVIHLTAKVVEICREQVRRYPSGPLFRTATGKPFPQGYYLARLVREVRRKAGLPESVIPYGFRHVFATDALGKGEVRP